MSRYTHKVHTDIGREISTTLNILYRRHSSNIYNKNTLCRKILYTYDVSNPIHDYIPTISYDDDAYIDTMGNRIRVHIDRSIVEGMSSIQTSHRHTDIDDDVDDIFDYSNKNNEDDDGTVYDRSSSNRFNMMKRDIDDVYDSDVLLTNHIKDEMVNYRHLISNHDDDVKHNDDHTHTDYTECFPTYNDDDYQMSVKDGLGKRPPTRNRKKK